MNDVMTSAILGWVVAHIVEFLKVWSGFTWIDQTTTRRVQFAVTFLGLAGNTLLGVLGKNLDAEWWKAMLKLLVETLWTFMVAEYTYHQTMKTVPASGQ